MYTNMEQQQLDFIRFNQKALCADYNGCTDAIRIDDIDMPEIRKRAILPSTFIDGTVELHTKA
jgi:hypothetical protein